MSRAGGRAEARFECYLRELGYGFDHEPDLGNGKRPDYLVQAGHVELACAVESFDTAGAFQAGRVGDAPVGAWSRKQVLSPIRKQIGKAAERLKGISGRPLVVVLVNPLGSPVLLDGFSIMAGVHHGYISAVVVLRREDQAFKNWARWWWGERDLDPHSEAVTDAVAFLKAASGEGVPHNEEVHLEIFETISDQAVPLPRDVFNRPHDRRWVPNDDRTALIPLA
ncbi:hypothetical protein ACWEOG_03430 [Amycolatopsis japonica]